MDGRIATGHIALYLAATLALVPLLKKLSEKNKSGTIFSKDILGEATLLGDIMPPSSPGRRGTGYKPYASTPKSGSEPLESDQQLMLSPATSNALLVAPLVSRISSSSESGGIIVIGIAGGSGSGKTTLAKAIYESIGEENITYISHDSYYRDLSHLKLSQREKQNFDHPDSLETSLLVEHVKILKSGAHCEIPTYDFKTHARRAETQPLIARAVILVEGILIFTDPALYELIDIRLFVDTDDDIRLIRRIQRDTIERGRTLPSVIKQYIDTVRPMHLQFVEPSKRNADIIVPVGLNSVALDLVVSKLKSHLNIPM